LRELDEVIKAKKQAASDAEIAIKKLDHEVQALAMEKTGHVAATMAWNLEKYYEWITEECPWVKEPATADIFADLVNARVSRQSVWPSGIAV
jgi:structural maintenance of chromosome 2